MMKKLLLTSFFALALLGSVSAKNTSFAKGQVSDRSSVKFLKIKTETVQLTSKPCGDKWNCTITYDDSGMLPTDGAMNRWSRINDAYKAIDAACAKKDKGVQYY